MKSLGKIVRSVQAFGREFSRKSRPLPLTIFRPSAWRWAEASPAASLTSEFLRSSKQKIFRCAYHGNQRRRADRRALLQRLYIQRLEEVGTIRASPPSPAGPVALRLRFERSHGFVSKRTLKVKTFEEMRIPLGVTATDFNTGEGVVFHSGSIVDPCAPVALSRDVFASGDSRALFRRRHAFASGADAAVAGNGRERVLAVHLKGTWANGGAPDICSM